VCARVRRHIYICSSVCESLCAHERERERERERGERERERCSLREGACTRAYADRHAFVEVRVCTQGHPTGTRGVVVVVLDDVP
jgi:hypothetical protein